MEPRFVLPITTMLAGLALWLVYAIARALSRAIRAWPAQADLAVALVTGGLFVLSGFA